MDSLIIEMNLFSGKRLKSDSFIKLIFSISSKIDLKSVANFEQIEFQYHLHQHYIL